MKSNYQSIQYQMIKLEKKVIKKKTESTRLIRQIELTRLTRIELTSQTCNPCHENIIN
jgi:hypothetical protein